MARPMGPIWPHSRGVAIFLTLAATIVLVGFAALTIDVGAMYSVRADLQNAADSSALATAGILSDAELSNEEALELGRITAADFVKSSRVFGKGVEIDPLKDIVFGRANYDPDSNAFNFTPDDIAPDAVRITVRHTDDSPNGAVPLFFARIWGKNSTEISASAVAGLTGLRDLSVVIDLSGSMKHDSYLRFHHVTQINSRDVWCALDGPPPSRPYIPGPPDETEYADDFGPTIGIMSNWGVPILPGGEYDTASDTGLWYIPEGANCNEPEIADSLNNRGYTAQQIAMIMGSGGQWRNRTAVMIGLAEWTPSNAGDLTVGSDELEWIPYPPYRKSWAWTDYLDWASEPNSKLTKVHPMFQYYFGVKTYVDFLLDRVDNFSKTDLTATPEQPLRAVKDAVQTLVDTTRLVDSLALEVFGSTGRHEVDLTHERQQIADRLYEMQPNHYDNSTNMGEGLQRAIDELTSFRARDKASKVIVLMSDGHSTMGPDPVSIAQDAASHDITIYTVSVGYGADRDQLRAIAEATGGREFYAAGTPEQYTADLQRIFRTIGRMGQVALIE